MTTTPTVVFSANTASGRRGTRSSPSTRRSPTAFTATQRGHDETVLLGDRSAEPSRSGVLRPPPLGDGASGADADPTVLDGPIGGGDAGGVALLPSGADRAVADDEVEHGEADDDRDRSARGREADAPLLAPRMTPSAAASPKAEPPLRTTASSRSTVRWGSSSASSRDAGAPPRTSPDATVPSGSSTTVQPVRPPASVQCPTRTPGTAVITRRARACRTRRADRPAPSGARASAGARRQAGRAARSRAGGRRSAG